MKFQGDIIVINTKAEMLEALKELSQEKFIGFDTETKPSFQKNKSF